MLAQIERNAADPPHVCPSSSPYDSSRALSGKSNPVAYRQNDWPLHGSYFQQKPKLRLKCLHHPVQVVTDCIGTNEARL